MKPIEVLEELHHIGALVVDSHIRFLDGTHSDTGIKRSVLYRNLPVVTVFARAIAEQFDGDHIDAVVSEGAKPRILLAELVAQFLTKSRKYPVIVVPVWKQFAGYKNGNPPTVIKKFAFSARCADLLSRGRRVLVVKDIVNTCTSAKKIVALTRKSLGQSGGMVCGFATVCNLTETAINAVVHVPKAVVLADMNIKRLDEETCRHEGPCSLGRPFWIDLMPSTPR